MAIRRKTGGDGGGHGGAWVVTFADLMSLLMAFFVMLVSFSTTETQKVAQAAGSIREAFGIQPIEKPAGMIEREGVPVRQYLRSVGPVDQPQDVEYSSESRVNRVHQGPEANTHDFQIAEKEKPHQYLSAAASLRQALSSRPDIAELSRQMVFEETDEGLNLKLIDQDGRSMFERGSTKPTESLRMILEAIAPVLAQMPNRIRITGHTASDRRYEPAGIESWRISSGRALVAADLLGSYGLGSDHVESVVGKADSDPLFPNDPALSANRRIEILLIHEPPPLPLNRS